MFNSAQRNTISWYLGNDDAPLKTGRYTLTDRGRDYIANGGDMDSTLGRIITSMVADDGSMTIDRISTESGVSSDVLSRMLPRMVRVRYVQEI